MASRPPGTRRLSGLQDLRRQPVVYPVDSDFGGYGQANISFGVTGRVPAANYSVAGPKSVSVIAAGLYRHSVVCRSGVSARADG